MHQFLAWKLDLLGSHIIPPTPPPPCREALSVGGAPWTEATQPPTPVPQPATRAATTNPHRCHSDCKPRSSVEKRNNVIKLESLVAAL